MMWKNAVSFRCCRALLRVPSLVAAIIACGSSPLFADPPNEAVIAILKAVEDFRSDTLPRKVEGTVTRLGLPELSVVSFAAEWEGEKHRITSNENGRSVAIHDGSQLFSYDGRASAIVSSPDKRLQTGLSFDPRTAGMSTGLYSDCSLDSSLAYRSGRNVAVVPLDKISARWKYSGKAEVRLVQLTDRFHQVIHFAVEVTPPHRVVYYSKTVPKQEGEGISAIYVAESFFEGVDSSEWFPERVVMYSLRNGEAGQRRDEIKAEFKPVQIGVGLPEDQWGPAGLKMPSGQPLVDLRISKRIGYWDGNKLIPDPPPARTDHETGVAQ